MTKENSESEFLGNVRNRLDASVDDLDAGILSHLRQAREKALDSRRVTWWEHLRVYRSYLAAASAAAAILIFALIGIQSPPELQRYSGLEDIELLAAGDNLEFYTELDFYTWLAEEMDNAG